MKITLKQLKRIIKEELDGMVRIEPPPGIEGTERFEYYRDSRGRVHMKPKDGMKRTEPARLKERYSSDDEAKALEFLLAAGKIADKSLRKQGKQPMGGHSFTSHEVKQLEIALMEVGLKKDNFDVDGGGGDGSFGSGAASVSININGHRYSFSQHVTTGGWVDS